MGFTLTALPSPASSVTLISGVPSPQVVGAQVTFTAGASGGSGGYQYQFYLRNPQGVWSLVQPYGSASTWTWNTASGTPGSYELQVWARSAGMTASYDTWKGLAFTVVPAPPTSVTFSSSIPSPQAIGAQVTFNATASGGGGSYEYLFYLRNPQGTWSLVQPYGPTSSWTWNTAGCGDRLL